MAGVAEFTMGFDLLWTPLVRRLSALALLLIFCCGSLSLWPRGSHGRASAPQTVICRSCHPTLSGVAGLAIRLGLDEPVSAARRMFRCTASGRKGAIFHLPSAGQAFPVVALIDQRSESTGR